MKKGNLIGTLVGLVVLFGGKYIYGAFFTSVGIEAMSMAGAGWDDSRETFLESYKAEVNKSEHFKSVPEDVKERYINCLADKTVEFLNQTECKYLYNQMTTSKEEHLKEQDACVQASGLGTAIAEKHVPACVKVAQERIGKEDPNSSKQAH